MESKILSLHKSGLSNRQIAISLGLGHHGKVSIVLKKNGLRHNGTARGILLVEDGKGKCTKCDTWKELKHFKINRAGKEYSYRLTSCNNCTWKQRNKYLNTNESAYIRDRFNTLKQHAKRRGREFSLTLEDVELMLQAQKGRCAYTDAPMKMAKGAGLLDDTMSFDRWDSSLGYTVGNVLLCTKKINVVKSNLTTEEFKKYMPKLHKNGLRYI